MNLKLLSDRVKEVADRCGPSRPCLLIGGDIEERVAVARELHDQSKRKDHPFLVAEHRDVGTLLTQCFDRYAFAAYINGARYTGAYTAADFQYKGLLEQAESGTVVIPDFGNLSDDVQSQFNSVLRNGQIVPVANIGFFSRAYGPSLCKCTVIAGCSSENEVHHLMDRFRIRLNLKD